MEAVASLGSLEFIRFYRKQTSISSPHICRKGLVVGFKVFMEQSVGDESDDAVMIPLAGWLQCIIEHGLKAPCTSLRILG